MDGTHEKEKIPKRIVEIQPIEASRNTIPKNREELKSLVEEPLLPAAEELYDNNVLTLSSSANIKDIETGSAYLNIDYESLSDENKQIAKQKCKILEADGRRIARVEVPITAETNVRTIQEKFLDFAHAFKKQKMTWAITYTREQLVQCGMDQSWNDLPPEEIANRTGYFYNPKDKLYYPSREQYIKAKEL